MVARPPVTVSALDLERLERLLDSLPAAVAAQAGPLREELARAEVAEPAAMPPDVVTMNSRVRFTLLPSGQQREMTLVYPRDADGSADRISVLAPVGSALLGLRVGDTINWPAPAGGDVEVRIDAVTWQPEAAGERHR